MALCYQTCKPSLIDWFVFISAASAVANAHGFENQWNGVLDVLKKNSWYPLFFFNNKSFEYFLVWWPCFIPPSPCESMMKMHLRIRSDLNFLTFKNVRIFTMFIKYYIFHLGKKFEYFFIWKILPEIWTYNWRLAIF